MRLRTVVGEDQHDTARRAAHDIASLVREAVQQRGTASLAVSGGSTPGLLFDALAALDVPWGQTHVFQVDERVAPAGHADRNLVQLQERLLARIDIAPTHVHPIPVELPTAGDAARTYAKTIRETCGAIFDVVHLGLGDDGHTASLLPHDPVLDVATALVATTRPYNGRRRITLTFRSLAQARALVWLATGPSKAEAVARLCARDQSIPAGRVRTHGAETLYIDRAANGPNAPVVER